MADTSFSFPFLSDRFLLIAANRNRSLLNRNTCYSLYRHLRAALHPTECRYHAGCLGHPSHRYRHRHAKRCAACSIRRESSKLKMILADWTYIAPPGFPPRPRAPLPLPLPLTCPLTCPRSLLLRAPRIGPPTTAGTGGFTIGGTACAAGPFAFAAAIAFAWGLPAR